MPRYRRLRRVPALARELARNTSANALPEYAIVLACLTIISMIAFNTVAATTTNAISGNANRMTNSNLANYAGP